ncbi:3'-5' RNA exonuclease complex component, partial [Oleoguttula sp. CCFEE 5521]
MRVPSTARPQAIATNAHVCLSCRLSASRSSTPKKPNYQAGDAAISYRKSDDQSPSLDARPWTYGLGGPHGSVASKGRDEETRVNGNSGRWNTLIRRRRDGLARRSSTQSRSLHTRARHSQQVDVARQVLNNGPVGVPPGLPPLDLNRPGGIREQLRQWQETEGKQIEHTFEPKLAVEESDKDEFSNITRIGDAIESDSTGREEDEELQSMGEFARSAKDDLDVQATDPRAFSMGDLVELFSMGSEKESTIAVYVRTLAQGRAQFYTMQGRWVILPSSVAQYTIPGWVSHKAVKPLLKYLPDVVTSEEIEALKQQSFSEDLSVPRHIAAPLINRMVEFHNQSLDVYRKHAPALDNAHNILAHETDLRYGSLDSAANVLLQKSDDRHSLATLFTVRKALLHAGFAFGFHMRSHRTTQYLQIRSKAQVRMVEEVRGWLRAWQDDLAMTSATSEGGTERKPGHRTSGEAKRVHSFVKKCKEFVLKSRETRDVTAFGNIGPSKVKLELTPTQDSVNIIKGTEFNSDDKKLVQFIEAWACNDMFAGLPRLSALPPLIMQ